MRVWRISNFADLSGAGGLYGDGRWHRRGVPVIYCADHPSTSLLEILVHASRVTVPDSYHLIEIDIPDGTSCFDPDLSGTPDWTKDLAYTQSVGMGFFSDARSAFMRVPSVVMPKARNLLINPRHPDAGLARIVDVDRYPFDSRLFS